MSKFLPLTKLAFVCLALLWISPSNTFGTGHAKASVTTTVAEAEVNLGDYGAVGDGSADDAPALQRALHALASLGGGTLRVPAGRFALRTPVSLDFASRARTLRLRGVPSSVVVDTSFTADVLTRGLSLPSEFYPMTGESETALRLSGLDSLEVRDLAFVGTPGFPTDARITLDFDRIGQINVYHCEFYGLRTDAPGGAIISAARSRLRVEQSMFLGSFGYSALYVPVIQALEWEDIHVTSTIFADYGQHPGFHGKTQGATFSWVTVGDPSPPTPLSPRREVIIRDVIFDEGAMFGLFSQPERYRAPSPAVDLILISDLFQNVSNLGTAGTLIYDARRVLIERTHYGYSRYTSGAIDLRGVGAGIVDRTECVDAADLIRADAATGALSVINSVYRDVLSQAAVTRLLREVADEDDPVWYVRRAYQQALRREPEPAEHFYWSQRLLECLPAVGSGGAGAAECVRSTRAALAAYLAANPATTFALAGKVTGDGGSALSGVTVTLSTGGEPLVAARTDERGEYRFAALPTGGEYTVTAAADHYLMEPAAQTVVTPVGDRRADFAARARTFAVRGRVVTTNNYGFAGVRVALTGGATAETVTDAEGYFSFTGLVGLRSYTVTPRLAHHTFEAAAQTVGSLTSDQTLSFYGRLNRYTVSGRVLDGRGRAIVGAAVTLTGAQAGATTTDGAGRYAFAGLAATSSYTVTVGMTGAGAAGYTFTPSSRTYASLTGDEAGGDFTVLYSIRGRVTEAGAAAGGGTGSSGLAGVTVRLSGAQTATTVTDATGQYAFMNLGAGGNYTVTAEAAHYSFAPGATQHVALAAPQVSDFTATRNRHSIVGRVADTTNTPLGGVTVTLTGTPGTTTATTGTTTSTTTDAGGNYSFANLLAGYHYTLTAARTHYTFAPGTHTANNLSGNTTANFTATLKRYAIGGRITTTGADNLPLAGVSVTLSGAQAATTTTDAAGNYSFAQLAAGGSYVVTAAKTGYAFTPPSRTVNALEADRAEPFAATLERYDVVGRVVNINNYGLAGITVKLTGGASAQTLTDREGYFTFGGLEALGSYTVTPALRFHSFDPSAHSINSLTARQSLSFIARLDSHTIGGRVTDGENNALSGVSVTLTDAQQQQQTAMTSASGSYSFANLPAGGNYTVTASKPGYLLTPTARTVNGLEANRTESFVAIPLYTVAGTVTTADGKGLGGVTIALEGLESRTLVTDANGTYSFADIPRGASVTLTPSKKNYVLSPAQQTFVVNGNKPDVNFTAAPSQSVVQFSTASYQSNEGDAQAVITVVRTGNTSIESTFTFSTVDDQGQASCLEAGGAASFRCDYAGVVITLTFASGEVQKTITIPLIDDAHPEKTETLQFHLLNEGDSTALGTLHTASLTINDNDNAAAPNPIFATPLFVRMQYLDFLAREPEAGEPWSAVLNKCSDVNNNPACDRIHVSSSFFNSPEFRLKGFYAFTHYRVAFNRRPVYDEIIPDMRNLTGATEGEVYQKRADLSVDFTERAEFKKLYDALTANGFVNALLDRYGLQQITTPDPANPESGAKVVLTRADLIGRLGVTGAQSLTRAQVLRAVAESNEVSAAEYNGAFVAMQYYGYLRRSPDEEGYQAWLKVINQDSNNIRGMVNGFMNSVEYRLRFGQP